MPRLRLGVALLLPPGVAAEVDVLRRACGAENLDRVPPHCTLVPPVNVREDRLGDALDLLRSAASSTPAFGVDLGPPATFLPASPVLFLAVTGGADRVRALRDRVFAPPLARELTWPFVPHVTVLDAEDPARIEAGVAALAAYRASFDVERVHVLQEQRVDGRRVWRPIADAPLAPPAVVGRGGLELVVEVTERAAPDVAGWAALHDDRPAGKPVVVTGRRRGEVVGVAEGRVRGSVAHLDRVLVDPDLRGEGIGGHLLAAFASAAAERGSERVEARAHAGGRAERFLRERGFAERARLPAWAHGGEEVDLVRDL